MKRTGTSPYGFIAILSLIMLGCPVCRAESETGLLFHSYEVHPDERTSLIIPSQAEKAFSFDNDFELDFGVRIDSDKEMFGYICRIVLDGTQSLDIILSNPLDDTSFIAAVIDGRNLEKLVPLSEDFDYTAYIPLKIKLLCKEGGIEVKIPGLESRFIENPARRHELRMAFGANSIGRFSTTDVAPMCIRDLRISIDGHSLKLVLGNEEEVMACRGSVINGYWLADNNKAWREARSFDFDSRVFIATDPFRYRIYMISDGVMKEYDFRRDNVLVHNFSDSIDLDKITGDFFVESGRKLYYIDMESVGKPFENRFHMHENYWDAPIRRDMHSKYWHHNSFSNPIDSSVVQLFGYGFHRYLNEAVVWKKGCELRRFNLEGISPRYLSAVGVAPDSTLLVFGGKGNESGSQVLGARLYNDLYRVNLRDYSVTKLWDLGDDISEIAASDLIISPDGREFLSLMYNPNEFNTSLKLTRWSVEDGSRVELQSPAIPYTFVDIDSEARLFYDNKRTDAYYAIVSQKLPDGKYKVLLYRLNAPVTGFGQASGKGGRMWWLLFAGLAAAAGIAGLATILARRKRKRDDDGQEDVPIGAETVEKTECREPGIYILGGFRAIASDGTDISGGFSPLMRQLFSLIVLYSEQQSGVSNNELKDVFWYDKSTESFYNNRGVNIKKIRNLLSNIGDIEIVSDNGLWKVEDPGRLCDYNRASRMLSSKEKLDTEHILEIAAGGTLLPDTSAEWADRFKARYTEKMLDVLKRASRNASPGDIIRLSDAILCFDCLDEDAVRSKCKALISLKRHGTSKKTFRQFTENYLSMMGEEFKIGFNEFIAS
ncbi:MAG: bacterial transcriptional activator domain-containing protein [Candidatus Cryptobacteroides sp.]